LPVFGNFDFMDFITKHYLLVSTFLVTVMYIFIAGLFFLVLYKWKRNPFRHKQIQLAVISTGQYRREIGLTIITLVIYCITGYFIGLLFHVGKTSIYLNVTDYGIIYFIASILFMVFLHDTYFYWTHRLLHQPGWFEKVHITHHLSTNPDPWTALAFHPAEAIIQAAIFPMIILFVPVHPMALFIFLFYMIFMNVVGHSGFQIFPYREKGNKWYWWKNSSRQHNDHHQYARDNYGLYFTLWDRWMNTMRKQD